MPEKSSVVRLDESIMFSVETSGLSSTSSLPRTLHKVEGSGLPSSPEEREGGKSFADLPLSSNG